MINLLTCIICRNGEMLHVYWKFGHVHLANDNIFLFHFSGVNFDIIDGAHLWFYGLYQATPLGIYIKWSGISSLFEVRERDTTRKMDV